MGLQRDFAKGFASLDRCSDNGNDSTMVALTMTIMTAGAIVTTSATQPNVKGQRSPKLMVDTTGSATFVPTIKYKFHTLLNYKGYSRLNNKRMKSKYFNS